MKVNEDDYYRVTSSLLIASHLNNFKRTEKQTISSQNMTSFHETSSWKDVFCLKGVANGIIWGKGLGGRNLRRSSFIFWLSTGEAINVPIRVRTLVSLQKQLSKGGHTISGQVSSSQNNHNQHEQVGCWSPLGMGWSANICTVAWGHAAFGYSIRKLKCQYWVQTQIVNIGFSSYL